MCGGVHTTSVGGSTLHRGPRTQRTQKRDSIADDRTIGALEPALPYSGVQVINLDCDINKNTQIWPMSRGINAIHKTNASTFHYSHISSS